MNFLSPSAFRLLPCIILAGCMVGPDYSRPDTGLPGHFSEATVTTGAGSLVLSSSVAWWGAGVTTSAPVVP